MIVACLFVGQAVGAESTAEAIKAFGLVGIWSVDCSKAPMATCDKSGCGARTTYEVPPSGPPMIKNVVGTLVPDVGKRFETKIESATRIDDDKIKIMSIQQGVPGEISKLIWWRQPRELWETVLVKAGSRFRTYSAQREDGKKISAKDGFIVMPPAGTKFDEMPTNWVLGDKETPLFERCTD